MIDVASDVVAVEGDDVRDDLALADPGDVDVPEVGDQIELEIEDGVETEPIQPTRVGLLADLRDAVEARAERFGESVVDLAARRSAGADVGAEIAELVDGISVFGEWVITGVAYTPETLEIVPDLRQIHQSLIDSIDGAYDAARLLDPGADDDAWDEATTAVLDALSVVASILGDAS